MPTEGKKIWGALILADESAEWRIAGVRQIARLVLEMNEYFGRAPEGRSIQVCICWTCDHSSQRGPLPQNKRLTHVQLTDDLERFSSKTREDGGVIVVVNTRLLVGRGGFDQILQASVEGTEVPALVVSASAVPHASALMSSLQSRLSTAKFAGSDRKWCYLSGREEINRAERVLFAGTAKSQDGVVSRFINRPISRSVSRLLSRLPLSPNHWTLIMATIPVGGSIFVMQGSYSGFALGAVLFQIHSTLDGCDGEIARAKYLESDLGAKLDGLCDRFSTLLYAVSLGIGLFHRPGAGSELRWIYPWEGIVAALLIGVSETWLSRKSLDDVAAESSRQDKMSPVYLETHRSTFNPGDQLKLWLINNSGVLFLGDRLTSLFSQLTKRDVFNFVFMLLALMGWPQGILHILAVCACAIAIVALKDVPAFRQSN